MIAFLVRHFNDIDHMVPIVYKMLKETDTQVNVFCMNPFLDIRDDFRLNFLKKRFGCRTKYIYRAYRPTPLHQLFYFLVCWLPHRKLPARLQQLSRIAHRVARWLMGTKIGGRVVHHSAWRGRLYDTDWARRFLQKLQVSCLVIDCGDVARFIYRPLSDAADELGIPKIGVPHGIHLATNDDFNIELVVQQRRAQRGVQYGWLDEVIVQADAIKAKYIRNGFPPEKLRVLGSTRFCDEWMEVYHRILPPQPLPPNRWQTEGGLHGSQKVLPVIHQDIVESLNQKMPLEHRES